MEIILINNKELDDFYMIGVNDIYGLINLFEAFNNDKKTEVKLTEDQIDTVSTILYNIKDSLDIENPEIYHDMRNIYNFFVLAEQVLDKKDFSKIVRNMNLDKDGYSFVIEDLINFRKFISDFIPEVIKTGLISSVKLHKAIKRKNTSNSLDLFLSEFKKSSIAAYTELTTKIDNLKESGWISYVLKDGGEKDNIIHQNLINSYKNLNREIYDESGRRKFADSLNDLYKAVSIHMVTSDENGKSEGYQISKLDFTKNLNILKMSGKNQADSVVLGCPIYEHTKEVLFVSFSSSDDDKLNQNRQWVRHLEGIVFSIENNLNNFENIKKVKVNVLSLASLNDEETLNFKNYKLSNKEISSFRKINEIAELFKCFVEYNHRFSELCSMLNIKFIGSTEEINLRNKTKEQIRDLILDNLKVCVGGLNNALEKDKYMFNDLDAKKKKQYINSIKSIVEESLYYIEPNENLNDLIRSSISLFDNLTKYAGINEYKTMTTNLENYLKNQNQYYNINKEDNNSQNDYKFVKSLSRLNEIYSNIENYNRSKIKEIDEIKLDIEKKIYRYIHTRSSKNNYINEKTVFFNEILNKVYKTPHFTNDAVADFLNLGLNTFAQYKSNFNRGINISGSTNREAMTLISFLPKLNGMTHESDRDRMKSAFYENKLEVSLKNMKKDYKKKNDIELLFLIKEIEVSLCEIKKIRNANKDSILHKIRNSTNEVIKKFGIRKHILLNDSGINFNKEFLNFIQPLFEEQKNKKKIIRNK